MAVMQRTISKPVSFIGKGLHTGVETTLTFKPAPENTGYVFIRTDLEGQPHIKALAEFVTDTSRGTTIEQNGAKVSTIEHALAAVYGLELDNIYLEIDGPEVPILKGNSIDFIEGLQKVEFLEQEAEREYFEIKDNIGHVDPDKNVEYLAVADENYSLNVLVDYNSDVLTNQYASLNKISDFPSEIAKARTFVFLHELEFLVNNNLVKGGDLSNAIVIVDKEVSKETLDRLAQFFNQEKVEVVPEQGILNNLELAYPNEPARHKLLDVIGDLALIGYRLKGRIFARRPGHKSNVEFALKIRKIIKKQMSGTAAPDIDLNAEPLFDVNRIKQTLPHRYPFLLVDKIMQMDESSIIGVKNVTSNEPFFVGHFPAEPVMPGVLIIEAMAQTGGILVLNSVPDPENYSTYFMKIDGVKFKKKVVPGDTLVFKLSLMAPFRRGIAQMKAQAFVGETMVTEAEMMAQVVKTVV
ncbi:MAG: bifunctional UDP-3-O-[3-hydroxymyristoyl] N-acetylglucosamine deacetylase/3-hydroxyacyl-ACP dehydratase [Bacteroidales bacterium]|nr:bifunctional UDP-3-O-[3-hydroxymyristoyl] N-acetylglucosamine deacetylase/3-hydroxyacyl-ACP dehydratase [Bacteroidales bacterium]